MATKRRARQSKPGHVSRTNPLDAGAASTGRPVAMVLAGVLLVAAAAAGTFNCIWNADVFWHLAAGRWMFEHGRVLAFDPFTVNGTNDWVNVHWLFQLIITALHAIGGFAALTCMKSLLAATMILAFFLAMRKRVGPAWLLFCGLAIILVSSGRIRVRPETFTLLFIMLTIILLESVRLGGSVRRLWWLAPIMLLWVNMHGLYILGPALMWSAIAGALIDRKLKRSLTGGLLSRGALVAVLAAHVVCLLTPWPFRAAAQPFLLWTRISGQTAYYTYGVAELQPTWTALGAHWQGVVLTGLTVLAMRINFRRLPLGHVGWFLGFATLGLMARRNVGLTGPVFGYLLAWHGWAAWRKLARLRPTTKRLLRSMAVALMLIIAAGYVAGVTTGWLYRKMQIPRQFGAGLQPDNYPIAVAKFLHDLPAKGDIHCVNFGDASTFDYYTFPTRKVFMDGRLEAHSLRRFIRQHEIYQALRFPQSAGRVKIGDSVRFFIVRSDAAQHLEALMLSPRFRLVFLGPMAACFARLDYPVGIDEAPLPTLNLGDFDRRTTPVGTIENRPPRRRTWYRQNVFSRYYRFGKYFLYLGGRDVKMKAVTPGDLQVRFTVMSVRYFRAAGKEGIVPPGIAAGVTAGAYQQLARYRDVIPSAAVPIDIYTARALRLYDEIDLKKLSDERIRRFALQRVRTMLQGRRLDAANAALAEFLENLPGSQRVNPPNQYLELVNTIATELDAAKARLMISPLDNFPLVEQARRLTATDIGMIDRAVKLLENVSRRDAKTGLMLGDLLLRKGRFAEARRCYRDAAGAGLAPEDVDIRLALCDWVAGDLPGAIRKLSAIVKARGGATGRLYLAMAAELLGRYAQARAAIEPAKSNDPTAEALIRQVRGNLDLSR